LNKFVIPMLVMIGVLISLISLNQLTAGQPSELKCIKSADTDKIRKSNYKHQV